MGLLRQHVENSLSRSDPPSALLRNSCKDVISSDASKCSSGTPHKLTPLLLLAERNFLRCAPPVRSVSVRRIFLHPHTLAHMFISFLSARDPYVRVWTCQVLIRGYAAGFIDVPVRVCFWMSVTLMSCFHNVHLAGSAFISKAVPLHRLGVQKSAVLLRNLTRSRVENLSVFPVLLLILPAVGLKLLLAPLTAVSQGLSLG